MPKMGHLVEVTGRYSERSEGFISSLDGAWDCIGKISVIVPAFNEEIRIQKAIQEIDGFLKSHEADFEIVVVDDGSRDKTSAIVTELQGQYDTLRLLNLLKNGGKGAAVKAGILNATGQFLLFTDADQSTSIDQLSNLLVPLLEGNFDIAIGSRAAKGARIIEGQVWYRQFLGKAFGWLGKILVVRGYGDSQCGFKCFRRDAALKIFPYLTSDTVLFDLEALLLAGLHHLKVAEVPVAWVHNPDSRLVYDARRAIRTFLELLRLRKQWKVIYPVKVDISYWRTNRQARAYLETRT